MSNYFLCLRADSVHVGALREAACERDGIHLHFSTFGWRPRGNSTMFRRSMPLQK